MLVKDTDVRVTAVALYFLPVETRIPLKFGPETLTSVTLARVRMQVATADGKVAEGWGETPLSVQWVWPSSMPYTARNEALKRFCCMAAEAWAAFGVEGHPMEIGHAFQQEVLPGLLERFGREGDVPEPMPWLAALVCSSPFDIALHDAYGMVHGIDVYETYNAEFMNNDLAAYLSPADGTNISFATKFPDEYLEKPRRDRLPAWHLVGGLDPIRPADLDGSEPTDGHPVLLQDWIEQDALRCLKVKLRGNDSSWDYERLVAVGRIGMERGVDWLCCDFNCTVTDPVYVIDILDRLMLEEPPIYGMVLYVEQPFPYDLERHQIDVHSVSARKPLFMDESAHDWRPIKLGRGLGWTGVALKTCKTQTGALLSYCWAKAHGMTIMVQDLTNPMLAQITHVLLAAHAGTIMGVETNSMQFYPDASAPEAQVHPGIYRRRLGHVELDTLQGPGFGYAVDRIQRELPAAAVELG